MVSKIITLQGYLQTKVWILFVRQNFCVYVCVCVLKELISFHLGGFKIVEKYLAQAIVKEFFQ